jgi:PKD domain
MPPPTRIAPTAAILAATLALSWACAQSSLAPLPLEISVAASRTSAAPGDTVVFVATVQGGNLLGLDAEYGDQTVDQYGTAGARTGKVSFHHAYTMRGTFTAKITVTDATLGQKSASVEILVN